jgi:outer membrane receptor protein involved in Fe transport
VNATVATRYREVSVFANANYALSEQFDFQVGARYGEDLQSYDQNYRGLLYTPPVLFTQETRKQKATYLLTARFKPGASEAFYARVATGYRPGGPSGAPPTTGRSPGVDADSLISYEAGYKAVLAGGKLSFEAAVFRTDWKDIQIQTLEQGSTFFVNGGAAVSQGAEATLAFYPLAGLSLRAAAAYTDARLSEDTTRVILDGGTPGARPLGRSGDELPFVPRISASLAADYRWPVADGWSALLGASLNRTGPRASDFSGRGKLEVPGYTTLNLNAGIESPRWRVAGYVKNAGDSGGILYLADRGLGASTPTAPYAAGLIQPRTIGVEVGYQF